MGTFDPSGSRCVLPLITPSLGGLPDLGMALGVPPPATPMAGPTMGDRQEIIGPIESPTQIFYDMDVANFIENNFCPPLI